MSLKLENPKIKVYRELLGVNSKVTMNDLKKAFHERALLYHPDRNSDAGARKQFEKVKQAYEILKDFKEVDSLNKEFSKRKLQRLLVPQLKITLGSFFGQRIFDFSLEGGSKLIKLTEEAGKRVVDEDQLIEKKTRFFEGRSILDDPSFDQIEVVFGGRHSEKDEGRLKGQKLNSGGKHLPWVLMNNEALIYLIENRFERALSIYRELNIRIDKNIIFLYREALCELVISEMDSPSRLKTKRVDNAINLLRSAIKIAETRPVGKQNVLVIRKLLAELYRLRGRPLKSFFLWRQVLRREPQSKEAYYRVKGKRSFQQLMAQC